jgi:Origin recognition complex (ORC) subunit 4 C-terminus/AAA ATPase domain
MARKRKSSSAPENDGPAVPATRTKGKRSRASCAAAAGGASELHAPLETSTVVCQEPAGTRVATCDLTSCVARACARLRKRSSGRDEISTTLLLARALRDPAQPPACALVVAPRGAGKSAFVDAVLAMLAKQKDQGVPSIVRINLHGLLHTSVHSSTRVIAAALKSAVGRELLENPGSCARTERIENVDAHEIQEDKAEGEDACANQRESSGMAECNWEIAAAIRAIKADGKGVVFVLDDFDRFGQSGAAQPVLYNILNILQDIELRGACVGMTTRIDSADSLEKRIKSRFLPRELVLKSPQTIEEVIDFLSDALHLPFRDTSCEQDVEDGGELDRNAVLEFNAIAADFLASRAFRDVLGRQFCNDRSMGRIVEALCDALFALAPPDFVKSDTGAGGGQIGIPRSRTLDVEQFRASLGLSHPSMDAMIGLSVLELALLVALRKLEKKCKSEEQALIFGDVYDEYALIKQGGNQSFVGSEGEPVVERSVAEKAWSRLIEASLVVRVGQGPSAMRRVCLAVDPSDVDAALQKHSHASAFLTRWGKGIVE